MSLLVHEVLIGSGAGVANKTPLPNPPNSVPLVSVAMTHTAPVQVTHLQQKVVTITSNHSRLSSAEKGSRLADALAGIPPYSYSNASNHNLNKPNAHCRVGHQVKHSSSNIPAASYPVGGVRPFKTFSSTKTNILPFVLQDHNYGAPPPPTPPHSPTLSPVTLSMGQSSQVYKLQSTNVVTVGSKVTPKPVPVSFPKTNGTKYVRNVMEDKAVSTNLSKVGFQVSESLNNGVSSQAAPVASLIANMPLHQQQFMPKPSLYPSPHIPPPTSVLPMPLAIEANLDGNSVSVDTDDESRLSERSSSLGPSGEETETAPEGDGEEHVQADDSITRCICNFTHDDGYMIQCDRCFVWQHVDCMEIDRNNIPDEYLCEACKPRLTDKTKARSLQLRRRQEIRAHMARLSSSDSDENEPTVKPKPVSKFQERKVLKKKKIKVQKEIKSVPVTSHRRLSLSTKSSVTVNASNASSGNSVKVEERPPPKSTKRKRQSSYSTANASSNEELTNSGSIMFSADKVRSWIEDYEIAVTNHYSPELRAKVHAARINGISAEFRESTQGALLGHRCRIAPCYEAPLDSPEDKMLVAATRLKSGTAIIEYQGKYTLKSQWGAVQTCPNLPYLPFVLQYEMLKEGLCVCVDARTYGNDARFARRSSKSNAEIRHVVERGSLHLYIVASNDIEEEEEIALPLDTAVCLRTSPQKEPVKATPDPVQKKEIIKKSEIVIEKPKEETPKVPLLHSRKNGIVQNKKNLRKPLLNLSMPASPASIGRASRRTSSSENAPTKPPESKILLSPTPVLSPVKERKTSVSVTPKSPVKSCLKSPCKSPLKLTSASAEESSSGESPNRDNYDEKMDCQKMTREERKIAAYMKAFERMEKAAQRKQGSEKKRDGERQRKNSQTDDEAISIKPVRECYKVEKENKRKKGYKGSPRKSQVEVVEDYKSSESSEGERHKQEELGSQCYGSPPYSGSPNSGNFKFPKTKKSLMNEWLNETVDPVLHSFSSSGEVVAGVPTCYMRSPIRRSSSGSLSASTCSAEVDSRSAKKRWLRQAIIDGTEPPAGVGFFCSSPNSRPESPNGNGVDYVTPLKKRRLARESMSSEHSNTPPSTPHHSSFEEKYNEEMELDNEMDTSFGQGADSDRGMGVDEIAIPSYDVKDEHWTDEDDGNKSNLTVNIRGIKKELKEECKVKEESLKRPLEDGAIKDIKPKTKVKKKSVKVSNEKYSENKRRGYKADDEDTLSDEEIQEKKLKTRNKRKLSKETRKTSRRRTCKKLTKEESEVEQEESVPDDIKRDDQVKPENVDVESIDVKEKCIQDKERECSDVAVKQETKEESELPIQDIKKEENEASTTSEIQESASVLSPVEESDPQTPLSESLPSSEKVAEIPLPEPLSSSDVLQPESLPSAIVGASRSPLPESPSSDADSKLISSEPLISSNVVSKAPQPESEESAVPASEVPLPEPLSTSETVSELPLPESEPSSDWVSKIPLPPLDSCLNTTLPEPLPSSVANSQILKELDLPISLACSKSTDQSSSVDCTSSSKADEGTSAISLPSEAIGQHNSKSLDQESECPQSVGSNKCTPSPASHIELEVPQPKPAAVKRKLSILEYRKRKSISSDRVEPKEDKILQSSNILSTVDEKPQQTTDVQEPVTKPKPQERPSTPDKPAVSNANSESSKSFTPPLPSPLPEKVLDDINTATEEPDPEVKWNAAPTLLELQRENLTERLRKNFGLRVNGDNQTKLRLGITEKWRNLGKRFAGRIPSPDLLFGSGQSSSIRDDQKNEHVQQNTAKSTTTPDSTKSGVFEAKSTTTPDSTKSAVEAKSPITEECKPFPPPPLPADRPDCGFEVDTNPVKSASLDEVQNQLMVVSSSVADHLPAEDGITSSTGDANCSSIKTP